MFIIDGTPDAVKVACPVWSGGKDKDNIKVLPIAICGSHCRSFWLREPI